MFTRIPITHTQKEKKKKNFGYSRDLTISFIRHKVIYTFSIFLGEDRGNWLSSKSKVKNFKYKTMFRVKRSIREVSLLKFLVRRHIDLSFLK